MILVLFALLLFGVQAQECMNTCDSAGPDCKLSNQVLNCSQSETFSATGSLTFSNVTIYCFSSTEANSECVIQLIAPEMEIQDSFLLASSIEVNGTSVSLSNTVLTANGTAPMDASKFCLDKGGSYGGRSGGSCRVTCSGIIYGSIYMPTDYGAPGYTSASDSVVNGGGGRVIISAESLILDGGEISAAGNLPLNNPFLHTENDNSIGSNDAGGSGGSVLIMTNTYSQENPIVITVAGGSGGMGSYGGGGGRVALYGIGPNLRVITSGGLSNDTSRVCVLGGAGTLYIDSINVLVVDNNGIRTNNLTPVPGNETLRLQVINGAMASPVYCETALNFASVSVINALVLEAIDRLSTFSPFLLNISSPIIQVSSAGSIGSFETMWIVISTQNMTVDTSSGLFFGGLLNVTAYYLILNGAIEANVQTSVQTTLLISSTNVDILSEGIINADSVGIIAEGGSFYLQGDIQTPGSTCTDPVAFKQYPMYQCFNSSLVSLQTPDLSNLVLGNFTIFIQATNSLQVIDSGKLLGSRIGLCSQSILIEGTVSSTGFGCMSGNGVGKGSYIPELCYGSGGGYGGNGGMGVFFNETLCTINPGGGNYSSPNETWFEGSGGGSSESIAGAGGGFIEITGLNSTVINQGKVMANGEDSPPSSQRDGAGGGAGGSIWFTTQYLQGSQGRISAAGGDGAGLGAGGGGGRILFQWIGNPGQNFTYNWPNCSSQWENSNVSVAGGSSWKVLFPQQNGQAGTFESLGCSPGYFGPFCFPCPTGEYKEGWTYTNTCQACSNKPEAGTYTATGWTSRDCPYSCPHKYEDASTNPQCLSPLQVFMDYFGGPGGTVGFFIGAVCILTGLGFLAHAYTVKFVLRRTVPKSQKPFISSRLNVPSYARKMMSESESELTREDLPFHHKRFYLLGDNSYECPWSLPLVPAHHIEQDVIFDEFANFANNVNTLMQWHLWEEGICQVLRFLYHPASWYWTLLRRKKKYEQLKKFVMDYDEGLWKKVELRQLGNCLKISCSRCYTFAALDIMSPDKKIEEWDERPDLPLTIMCNGDGSFFCPHRLDNSDLMVQFLAYSLNPEHLELYYHFIDEFNTLSRTYNFRKEYPDTSQPQISNLIKLAAHYNRLIFNDRGFEVTPCLFQSILNVHKGKYIFTSLSYTMNSDTVSNTTQHLKYQDTTRHYCYKVGLVVTGTTIEDNSEEITGSMISKDSQNWQPLALDVRSEGILSSHKLALASLPTEKRKTIWCSVDQILASVPRGFHCVVLTALLLCMFTDLTASAVIILGFITEEYYDGLVLFFVIMPLTTIISQVMGWVMLFKPSCIRIFISFQMASIINVFATFIYSMTVEDSLVWGLFLVLDFLCKCFTVRLASMHLAHAETYTFEKPKSDRTLGLIKGEEIDVSSLNSDE